MKQERSQSGFTLVEMLVVIVIITILASLLVVLIAGMLDRARNTKTYAIVKKLDMGCASYRTDYGKYPPQAAGNSSAILHQTLGSERTIVIQYPSTTKKMPPVLSFTSGELLGSPANPDPKNSPVEIVDAYTTQKAIKYISNNGGSPVKNANAVDIWSFGKDGTDNSGDEIGNWIRDY